MHGGVPYALIHQDDIAGLCLDANRSRHSHHRLRLRLLLLGRGMPVVVAATAARRPTLQPAVAVRPRREEREGREGREGRLMYDEV